MTQLARRRSAKFVATITPAQVERKQSSRGAPYLLLQGAKFERGAKPAETRTCMAFGPNADVIRPLLKSGEPVRLTVEFDGATIKLIGAPRAAKTSAGRRGGAPVSEAVDDQLLLACVDSAGFEEHRRHAA